MKRFEHFSVIARSEATKACPLCAGNLMSECFSYFGDIVQQER